MKMKILLVILALGLFACSKKYEKKIYKVTMKWYAESLITYPDYSKTGICTDAGSRDFYMKSGDYLRVKADYCSKFAPFKVEVIVNDKAIYSADAPKHDLNVQIPK